MTKTIVEYAGNLECVATHVSSGAKIHTDAPKDNGGLGAKFSPTDLVAASLGSCIATILGLLAKRKGWDLSGMRLEIEKVMSKDAPRRIASLPVVVWMPRKLGHREREMIEHAARTCPVHQSLHPDIEAPIVFHWPEI